jgi:1-acyl-sn-glycerol-3-phosphate acyltransferase
MAGSPHRDRGARWGGPEPIYRILGPVLSLLLSLLFRLRVEGKEQVPRAGPALLVANHVSFLDPLLLVVVLYRLGRRARFFAHETVFNMPVRGWLLRTSRQIPVYRGLGTERATACVREALAADQVVVVYPAGTLPAPGECPPAKPGAGLVGLRCEVPVIPVALWGMQRRTRTKFGRFGRAVVRFGPPVELAPWAGRADDAAHQEAADHLLAEVRAMLPGTRHSTSG